MYRPLPLLVLLAVLNCQSRLTPEEHFQHASTAMRGGEDQLALDHIVLGRQVALNPPDPLWYWRFRLLEAEVRSRKNEHQRALALLEPGSPQNPTHPSLEARRLLLRGKVLKDLQRWEEAADQLNKALVLAEARGDSALMAETEIRRAEWMYKHKRFVEAELRVAAALTHLSRQPVRYMRRKALYLRGLYRLKLHRYDEAISSLEEALSLTSEKGPFQAGLLTNLGLCYARLGYFDEALNLLEQAATLHQEQKGSLGLLATWGETGNTYYFQGDYATAIENYRKAKDLAMKEENWGQASIWTGNLASALIESQQWEDAAYWNHQSLLLKEKNREGRSILYAKLNDAAIAAGLGRLDAATTFFEEVLAAASENPALKWEAHAGLGGLFADQGQWGKANLQFERAIAEIEATSGRLRRSEDEIFLFARLIRFYQNYVEALLRQEDQVKALEIAERSRARTLLEQIGGDAAADWQHFREKILKTAQSTNSVFLFYWLAPVRSYLWTISPAGYDLVELPGEAEIDQHVAEYRQMIESLRDPLERPSRAGKALFQMLVVPALPHIDPGTQVVVIPDGALHGLNFETLPIYEPKPHYWIEDVILTITPSLNLASRDMDEPSHPLDSLLLVGDPRSGHPDYLDLDFAKEEMRQIQSHFHGLAGDRKTILAGAAATPAAYRAAKPGSYSMIGFIAHAETNRRSPLDSAVILSPSSALGDFKLYARDILEMRLNAEVVTISACRGAGAKTLSGAGLVGFTWAFLQAGAHHVVAGLWDVDDRSTSRLMIRFYRGLAEGQPLARALRDAKLELLRDSGNFRKPYYWGPFQLYIRTPRQGQTHKRGP